MKTRNRILALLLALCMGVSLTACGSSGGEAPAADSTADSAQDAESPEAPATSEESASADLPSDVTLTFWTDHGRQNLPVLQRSIKTIIILWRSKRSRAPTVLQR